MVRKLRVVYDGEVFVPQEPCELPEGSIVDIAFEAPTPGEVGPASTADRERVLEQLTARMKANPIAPGAPRLTREQLHDRS